MKLSYATSILSSVLQDTLVGFEIEEIDGEKILLTFRNTVTGKSIQIEAPIEQFLSFSNVKYREFAVYALQRLSKTFP